MLTDFRRVLCRVQGLSSIPDLSWQTFSLLGTDFGRLWEVPYMLQRWQVPPVAWMRYQVFRICEYWGPISRHFPEERHSNCAHVCCRLYVVWRQDVTALIPFGILLQFHKSKAVPVEASANWGPQDFHTIGTCRCQGCQPYAPASFTLREIPGTHFYYRLSRPQGHRPVARIKAIKYLWPHRKSNPLPSGL
jgi:hypothetical protein